MEYSTTAEYNTAIANVQTAIDRALLVGQHSKNVTEGSERTNSEVGLDKLRRYKAQLIRERDSLGNTRRGRTLGASW